MNQTEIVSEVQRLLNDAGASRWTETTIIPRVNAAQIEVQKYAKAQKTTQTYTPTASNPNVAINANVIDIVRATYTLSDGTIKTEKTGFKPTSRQLLDFNRPRWQNEDPGEPTEWFLDASNQNIVLVPAPDSASIIADCVTLIEVRQPTALTVGGSAVPFDSSNLMVPFHRALIYWAVAECLLDDKTPDALKMSIFYRSNDRQRPGQFEKEIKMILGLFDVPEVMPAQIQFQPQGGRISGYTTLNQKANPLYYM